MSVTRDEVAHHVRDAFIGGGASRFDLLTLARVNGAPLPLLGLLQDLPDRRFEHLSDVLDCLAEAPATRPALV